MSERTFSTSADAIPAARRYVGELLEQVPVSSCETAAVLVSELVTNVVRHAGGLDFVVQVENFPREGRLWVGVTDSDTRLPVLRSPAVTSEHGRGIPLVSMLADRWGARRRRSTTEKTVWFELSYEPSR